MSEAPVSRVSKQTGELQGNGTASMRESEVDTAISSVPAVRARGPFYALTFRNFRLFFVGQLISVAGTWMQTVAQSWLGWELRSEEHTSELQPRLGISY